MSPRERPMLDLHKVHDLAALSDDEFRLVVDADLRRNSHSERVRIPQRLSVALRSPGNVERWLSMLTRMKASIDSQLSVREAEFERETAGLRRSEAELKLALLEVDEGTETHRAVLIKLLQTQRDLSDAAEEYQTKRARTMRFKGGLDETIEEARHLASAR